MDGVFACQQIGLFLQDYDVRHDPLPDERFAILADAVTGGQLQSDGSPILVVVEGGEGAGPISLISLIILLVAGGAGAKSGSVSRRRD